MKFYLKYQNPLENYTGKPFVVEVYIKLSMGQDFFFLECILAAYVKLARNKSNNVVEEPY